MTPMHIRAVVPALALSAALALGGPVSAQEATDAAPAPAAPAAAAPAAAGPAAPEAAVPRAVSARSLMTREERRAFRLQMRAAKPEERQQIWEQKRAELAQRAASRGEVLAEPVSLPGARGERGRSESGTPGASPRAP